MQKAPFPARILGKIAVLLFASITAHASVRGFGDGSISIKPYVEFPSYNIELKARNEQGAAVGTSVKLAPHLSALSGVDLSTSIIGLGYATKAVSSEEEIRMKGETDYDDYRLSLTFPSLFFLLNYQSYQGFFIENSTTIDPTTGGSNPSILYPDLHLTNASVNATYTFSPESFSLKAAWDQTVRQSSSGGSWLAGVYVGDTRFKNNAPLVPSQIRSGFGVDQDLREGRFSSVIARGGYGHTFVLSQKWFFSLTGLLGFGPQMGKTYDGIEDRKHNTTASLADFFVSTGFNGDTFFAGFYGMANLTNYTTQSVQITSAINVSRIYLGVRF